MDVNQLRQRHKRFVYKSFSFVRSGENLNVEFHFHIDPDLEFVPTLKIPFPQKEINNLDNFVFHLGLIEMISYWKAVCSPEVIIEPGCLSQEQIAFWKNLIINGLGEFFYINQIDFSENMVSIKADKDLEFPADDTQNQNGNLILIGGGKDSAVTAELIKDGSALLLNPTKAATEIAKIAGFEKPIIIIRTIDPLLLQLNESGYLNGHTPFSAYLSFLSLLVAKIYGFKNIIVSNESSSGEANLEYLGHMVNHQYSKSYEYEKKFREYSNKFLSKNINYFSFTRPLNELQTTALFLETQKYDLAFNSCNVSRNEYWCGECAKCAFVYLMFTALGSRDRVKKIFSDKDLFENEKIKKYIEDLTGNGGHKPLDCVGTEEESRLAQKLIQNPKDQEILHKIKDGWSKEHFLPPEFEKLLKDEISTLNL